jgi:CubicO group peptidase (beta-lactamase class C family)
MMLAMLALLLALTAAPSLGAQPHRARESLSAPARAALQSEIRRLLDLGGLRLTGFGDIYSYSNLGFGILGPAGASRLLADPTIDLMQRLATPGDTANGYGLGWGVDDALGIRRVQHTGGMPGVSTVLSLHPSERVAVVVLPNQSTGLVLRIDSSEVRVRLGDRGSLSTLLNDASYRDDYSLSSYAELTPSATAAVGVGDR